MKKKSIFKQMLVPMVAVVCVLAIVLTFTIVAVFATSFVADIRAENADKSKLVSGEIATFMNGAYGVTEELAVNPSILTMKTDVQTPILEGCVERNPYLELLYIQGTDGMQTGRSSGTLADRSTRWWFVQVMEEQKAFVSKSYYSVNTGMPCASIFFPMYDNQNMIGIFAVDIKLDYLQSLIEEFSDTANGEYSFVIDGEGVVVAHPDSRQIEELYNYKNHTKTVSKKDESGNPLTDADGNIITEEQPLELSSEFQQVVSDVMAGNDGSGKIKNEGASYYVSYATIPMKGESDSWSVITMKKTSAALTPVFRTMIISAIVLVLGVLAAVFMITVLARKLTKPIVSITNLIGEASEGDFSIQAEEGSSEELGTLSRSFNKMTGKISGILTSITTFSGEVVHSAGRMQTIEQDVQDISQGLREISEGTEAQNKDVNKVVSRAAELEDNFTKLREKNALLLQEVEETIVSQERGAESMEGLKKQNARTTQRMEESYHKILQLEEQSQQISGIVSTIGDISSQTSLLALNASIEAARAGDAGRGFAVVAESIGKLSQDSSNATAGIVEIITVLCQDIEATVADIQSIKEDVESQSEAVNRVEETFEDFKKLAERTRDSVNGIEELVVEMHKCDRSMVHAVERIREISSNTAGLSATAADSIEEQLEGIREVSERIENLSRASQEMAHEMSKFKLE